MASAAFADGTGNGDGHVSVTVSLGIVTFPDDAADLETMILEADQALFTAKRNGRNRIETVKPSSGLKRRSIRSAES